MSSRHQLGEGDGGAYSFCHVRELKEVERRENFEGQVKLGLEGVLDGPRKLMLMDQPASTLAESKA